MSAPPPKPQKPPKPPKPAGGSPNLPNINPNFPPLPETPQSPPVGKNVINRSIPPRKPRPVSVREFLPSPPAVPLSQGKPANGAPPALPPKPTPPPKPSVAEAPAALPSRPMPPIPHNQLSAPEIRPEIRKSGESVQFAVTPPEKRVSVNADLEKHLNARLRNSGGLGAPPAPPPPPEPEEKPSPKSSASKLLRPKKTASSKRASTKASTVFGTLPRLMGNKDGSKEKVVANDSKDSAPPAMESPRGSHGSPEISHSLPPAEAPPAPAESNVKWKRGAEAEAILKLLAEQAGAGAKDPAPGAAPTVGSGSGDNIPTSAPRIDFLDTSEIMKILGIEEGGIKLPEKQRDGEEKALDPVTELQLTERNFIADLGLLMQTFTKPVRDKDLLPLAVIESMELNLDRLICLHRELYQQILADSTVAGIARSFSDELIRELERLYTVYMGHYEGAIQVFYDKRDNVANFRKFLKQREQMTDKSIPNLLVTPVQRVCKYELMLASIHKSLRKQIPPPTDDQHFNLLNARITQLNTALQNVDHRRAAADNWEKVHQLEKSLTFSEPLAKPDRRLILEADSLIRVGDQEHVFKLVLFNDILLRAKISKRNKKGNVLDSIPLHELLWVDVTREQSADATPNVAPRHSFLLTSSNPRGDIWTVHTNSEADKVQWLSHLAELALPYPQFCHQWNVQGNGSLLGIDKGRWPQEYVNDVRLFLTSTHLCILWKMFGSFEREKIALEEIQSVQTSPKDRSLTLKVSNWKRNYTFVDLQNLAHTEAALNLARQSAKTNGTDFAVLQPVQSDNFSLSTSEWDRVWSNASSRVYQTSTVLQSPAPTLYKLLRGTVSVKKSPTEDVPILPGSIFGVSSFLSSQSRFPVVCSSEVHLLEIERDKVFTLFDGLELARFFASLALCTSLV